MRSKPKPVSIKPAVAYSNHAGAISRIAAKRDLLVKITTHRPATDAEADEHRAVLATLPSSVRQFNLWTAVGVPKKLLFGASDIERNANETLRKSDLLASVQKAVELVNETRLFDKQDAPRAVKLSRIRRDLDLANTLREIAEREVLKLRDALMAATDELRVLTTKLRAAEREGSRQARGPLSSAAKGQRSAKVVQLGTTKRSTGKRT